MSGSVAEERIREKVVAGLRTAQPDARIIHELVIGACRADVAAVTLDAITLVEIKSERDTLTRLALQLKNFAEVTQDVRVYAAAKHRPNLERMSSHLLRTDTGGYRGNPEHVAELDRAHIWSERDDAGFDLVKSPTWVDAQRLINPAKVWNVLWADEMRVALGGVAQGLSKTPMRDMTRLAVENLSGRQIRQAVCLALRSRQFARADNPVGGQ